MSYEAPKLSEVGSVRGLTLGNKLDWDMDDNMYVFIGRKKVNLPLGDGS